MTTVDNTLSEDAAAGDALPAAVSRWDRFEALLARLSERINPILVREARQALRSKQFTATFFVMLAAGWIWSILGLAAIGPRVYYASTGPIMFAGYFLILAFPLLIVAPYAAFHSLSTERQDRTYELVAITTLNARQIISGKLCGMALQMMVYLSAIFPCLAFTYLLRGLDIFTIILTVVYTCCISLGMGALGLMLATLAPPRQRQIGQAVIFAVALFGCFFFNVIWMIQMIASDGLGIFGSEFWQINVAFLTWYANTFALVFLSARSQLMTVCQNRSTALRVALVVCQLSLVAWFAWAQMRWGGEFMLAVVVMSTLLWAFAGMFLIGESPVLSERVKRDLPQSWLGRMFLSWFAPGPASGYMFVIANMVAVTVITNLPYVTLNAVFHVGASPSATGVPGTVAVGGTTRPPSGQTLETCVVATCYLVIYLGLAKLILTAISRLGEVKLVARVVVCLLLLLLGSGAPWAIQMTNPAWRHLRYNVLQVTNPIWTMWEYCVKGPPLDGPVITLILVTVAGVVWLLNFPSIAREVQQVRIAKPERILEEDAELAAAATGPVHTSPWD